MTDRHAGALYAVAAFAFWGLTPIYWKQLQEVSALQLLGHRIAWSLPCLLILLLGRRKVPELRDVLRNSRVRWVLLGTTVLIATNWLTFIWAVNSGRILEASLGYYINPLMNVGLGALVLGERPSRAQGWAVLLAVGGVALMAWKVGGLPWPALVLALSFGLYGLVRKLVPAGALVGLTVEVGLLFPIVIAGLLRAEIAGEGAFLSGDLRTRLLLIAAGIVTAMPLLLFTEAARRIRFSTLGFLQYLAPTGQFLLAVLVYGEVLGRARLASFVLIWIALALYSFEAHRLSRRLDPDAGEGG